MKPLIEAEKPLCKYNLLNCIIIIFCLYTAREIFIPLALATLLSFILMSLIDVLEHYKFPKVLATWISLLFAFFLITLLGWIMYFQALQLAQNIPKYELNVHSKVHSFMQINQSVFSNLDEASSVLKNLESSSIRDELNKQKPIPVEVRPSKPSTLSQITQLSPLLNPLETGLLILVFLPYILFNRQDLRERLILLIAREDLNRATQAIDDTAFRVTRYLLLNLSLNGLLGLFIGVGLYFIGIPNAFLWGFLTTFLRFIPYLGVWIAAFFPLAVGFALDPGWSLLVSIFCLFIFAEMASNYFFEPKLFGIGTGISSFALIIASVFWTWLWGIAGLFLSVPLTVCLFMLGKYVTGLEFLEIILGNNPFLNPPTHLYQCYLAKDKSEILNTSQNYLKNNSLLDYFDQLLIPALSLAKKDRFNGTLAEHRQQFILEYTKTLIDLLKEHTENNTMKHVKVPKAFRVICLSARDEFDELVALMLKHYLNKEGISVFVVECVATIEEIKRLLRFPQSIVCISSLPPYALSPARHLYRKIKRMHSGLKTVIGIWGAMPSVAQLESAWEGCAATVVTLKEMMAQIKLLLGTDEEKTLIDSRSHHFQKQLGAELAHVSLNELSLSVFKKIAKAFDVPISLISILELDPHFWKDYPDLMSLSNEAQDNLIQSSVCSYMSTSNETLLVPNIKKDPRFCTDTWLSDRGILFFAGTPLRSDSEHVVGILCVIDTKVRKVSKRNLLLLETLSNLMMQTIIR